MTHFTDITGSVGVSIAIALIIFISIDFCRTPLKRRAWLVGVIFIAALLSFANLSVAGFVRGISGDLSITTLVLMCVALCVNLSGGAARDKVNAVSILALVAIFAFVLYPFALGIGLFDPYRLGYGNLWFIGGLLLLALIAWKQQYILVALSISLALLAWSGGWYESNNLWDYLLDPWLSIYALVVLVKRGVSMLAKQFS